MMEVSCSNGSKEASLLQARSGEDHSIDSLIHYYHQIYMRPACLIKVLHYWQCSSMVICNLLMYPTL